MPAARAPLGRPGHLARRVFSAYGLIGLHLIVIVAIGIAVIEFREVSADRASSREYIAKVDSLQVALLDAEIAVESYVLTGNEAELEPLDRLLPAIEAHTTGLVQQARPGQQQAFVEALPALLSAKIDQWERTVELGRDGNSSDAIQTIVDARSQALLSATRANLDGIRVIESRELSGYVDMVDRLGVVIGVLAVALVAISLVVTGWLLVVARRRHENEALRRLNASKDQFVGFVSHEIRRPIAIIEGNARLVERAGASSPEIRTSVAEIQNASLRLEAIVSTLLALSRAEAGGRLEVEPVLVERIAERAAALHRTQYPHRQIDIARSPNALPALGDRNAIEQVLVNLLSNAEKYGDGEAPIRITVESQDGHVVSSVRNYGPPQRQEQFEDIFEPFTRSPDTGPSEGSFGLGLTVSHRLISAQGGDIAAEALSDGACFRFTLPAAPEPADA